MNVQAADITGFRHQVGGYVRAFYRGGNDADDVVVGYAFRSLPGGNKCVRFAGRVSPVRDPVPAKPMTCEGVLPFFAEEDTIPDSRYIPVRQFLGNP